MKKLTGLINLTRIPKDLIRKNKDGESIIFVDIVENKDGVADKYGNTHSLQMWSKEKGTIYLGNLKPKEFGKAENPQGQQRQEEHHEDLPF